MSINGSWKLDSMQCSSGAVYGFQPVGSKPKLSGTFTAKGQELRASFHIEVHYQPPYAQSEISAEEENLTNSLSEKPETDLTRQSVVNARKDLNFAKACAHGFTCDMNFTTQYAIHGSSIDLKLVHHESTCPQPSGSETSSLLPWKAGLQLEGDILKLTYPDATAADDDDCPKGDHQIIVLKRSAFRVSDETLISRRTLS